jgi:hypothetical protein
MAAFGRSTRMAISGRPSSRLRLMSARPGVFHHVARVIRGAAHRRDHAAYFQLQAAGLTVVVRATTAEEAHDLVVAARRVRANDDAWQAGELPAQRDGDFFVRALTLTARLQDDADLAAAGVAAAALVVVSAASALRDDRRGFRDELLDALFENEQHFLGALDASAERELGVDVDLAFVRLRHQLGFDPRIEHGCQGNQSHGAENHRRTMLQGDVDGCPVAFVHRFEETLS